MEFCRIPSFKIQNICVSEIRQNINNFSEFHLQNRPISVFRQIGIPLTFSTIFFRLHRWSFDNAIPMSYLCLPLNDIRYSKSQSNHFQHKPSKRHPGLFLIDGVEYGADMANILSSKQSRIKPRDFYVPNFVACTVSKI